MTYIHYTPTDKKNIFLIDMRDEQSKPWSELVIKGLTKFIAEGKKIALIVNKKGFASGSTCNECGHVPRCKQCDIAVAVHKQVDGTPIGLCHICKCQYTVDAVCTNCGGTDTRFYGLGTQQVSEWIQNTYGISSVIIQNTKVNSPKKIASTQEEIGAAKIIIGTTLLSQKIHNREPDAVIVIHADGGLHIPDFQASRKTFLFLYDLLKHSSAKNFLFQSYNPEHPVLHYACTMDIEGMKEYENTYRKQCEYPPYVQMCTLLYKHEIEERLFTTTNKLFQELLYLKETYELEKLEIYTTPPMIYKMFGKYRYTIILKGAGLREFMDIAYSKLKIASRGFKVDREPQQLT